MNIIHKGVFKPEELPRVLDGSYGLVWDGDSLDECSGNIGEYLKINKNPKTIDIDKETKVFVYNDESIFFYKDSIFKNNDFIKRIKFKNERDLAKEISLLI